MQTQVNWHPKPEDNDDLIPNDAPFYANREEDPENTFYKSDLWFL